jgi:hypothetical protein
MDLAKDRKDDLERFVKFIGWIIKLANLCLIGYLIWLQFSVPSQQSLMEFISIRNVFYSIYTFSLGLYGFFIMFRSKKDRTDLYATSPLSKILPMIIISIIITTFSYALAGLLYDILSIFYN